MNIEEYKRDEMKQELAEDEYYEANKQEFLVKFKGSIYVEALTEDEAIDKASECVDLFEYIDDWKCGDYDGS